MTKKVVGLLLVFIIGMVGGIFAEEIFWPYFVERPLFHKYKLDKGAIFVTERKEITIQENTALKEAIAKIEKTVVFLRSKTKKGKILEGCGFTLTSDGLIVTLNELLPEGSTSSLFVEGEIVPFQILKRDPDKNLVLLKVDKKNLATAGFFDFEKLKLGERVFLVGISFEEGRFKKFTEEGIVRSFDERKIETNIQSSKELLGTPLFDIEGNILGLNYQGKDGKLISIPVNQIKSFVGI